MRIVVFLLIVASMSLIAFGVVVLYQNTLPLQEPLHLEPFIQQEETQILLTLSFPVNGTTLYLDGNVSIDGQVQGETSKGAYTLKNSSAFPRNVSLIIHGFEIRYALPQELNQSKSIQLLVSQEEYERYKNYIALSQKDSFPNAQHEHWSHMPLKIATNFLDYNNEETRRSKELKVEYALERLHNSVPSISFERTKVEQDADIVFIGEIPAQIRAANQPDGNFNIAGLALHNVTGNIIFKAEVYLPLPVEGEECPSSDIALHELLHAFGLPHSTNIKSVLWDTASCTNNEIISEDIALLKKIYG